MSTPPESGWLNALLEAMQAVQLALLRALDALGLAGAVHGQPAWPWAHRLTGEYLLMDLGQARRLAVTLAVLAAVVLALLAALAWRRGRPWLLAAVPVLLVLAPWPQAAVVWVPATPASFHRSPTGFGAAAIARGQGLYVQHCAACHGSDGRGHGPLAASQPVWPPNLAGPLLWRRADGDLLWHVLHGMRDARTGRATMPGFAGRLTDADAWALIDFMKAQGAGQALRAAGFWPQPVRLPQAQVRCAGGVRWLSSWQGQRLRVVAEADAADAVLPDPRVVTVLLRRPGASHAVGVPPDDACVADDEASWRALALIAGLGDEPQRLAGLQFIADRGGWLRARGQSGAAGWTEDDLLCRTTDGPRPPGPVPPDGLGALIARMDAEPVRFVKGGFVH